MLGRKWWDYRSVCEGPLWGGRGAPHRQESACFGQEAAKASKALGACSKDPDGRSTRQPHWTPFHKNQWPPLNALDLNFTPGDHAFLAVSDVKHWWSENTGNDTVVSYFSHVQATCTPYFMRCIQAKEMCKNRTVFVNALLGMTPFSSFYLLIFTHLRFILVNQVYLSNLNIHTPVNLLAGLLNGGDYESTMHWTWKAFVVLLAYGSLILWSWL